MAARTKDPRTTLTAYGAPLFFTARGDMSLEEAVVRSLGVLRRDPTVLLSLPVVLVKNERALDGERAASQGEGPSSGCARPTGELSRRLRFRALARRLAVPRTTPRYLTDARSSFARRAADESTPPSVAR